MKSRKKALDLFCGAGGAAMGLHLAGYDVVGIDIEDQPSYPFEFIKTDAMLIEGNSLTKTFDLIWASPPCQAYSVAAAACRKDGYEYPDLVEPTRKILKDSKLPYIIENTPGAPLINPIMLCGTMFDDLKVFRHRVFESNYDIIPRGECKHFGHSAKKRRNDKGDFYTVAGHWVGTKYEWGDAMGIDWMASKNELAEAIPPDYSWFLAKQINERTT
jgi:DNA (cytosine-5)-methyltransferase 1